jgi:hypothetical protein
MVNGEIAPRSLSLEREAILEDRQRESLAV